MKHQRTSGPIRATKSDYRRTLTRPTGYVNAEAGPSTLPGPIPSDVGQPMTQPSGRSSETAADAATTRHNTEENKAQVSNFYRSHILRVSDWLSGVRSQRRPGHPRAKGKHARIAPGRDAIPTSLRNGLERKRALPIPYPFAMHSLVCNTSY